MEKKGKLLGARNTTYVTRVTFYYTDIQFSWCILYILYFLAWYTMTDCTLQLIKMLRFKNTFGNNDKSGAF